MKRILTGMLFRLVRGYEIWALLALFLFAVPYLAYENAMTLNYLSAKFIPNYTYSYDFDGVETVIYKDNAEQFCFKNSGLSAFDLYRSSDEKIPQDKYDKLTNEQHYNPYYEMETLYEQILESFFIPAILMVIFIPIFFGRMFSDGTIKNLVACGYSKRKIYLASMILTAVLDLTMILLSLLTVVVICICLQWQPPVYLPVLISAAVISSLILMMITSVSLAAMFAGGKKTLAFVAGFIIVAARFVPVSVFSSGLLWYQQSVMSANEISEDTRNLLKEVGRNGLERKLDLTEFIDRYYVNGKEIQYMWKSENSLHPAVCKTLITISYLDPYLIDANSHIGYGFSPYLICRDGLMAINIASNVFWIVVINGLGILIVNKRELHC